MKISMHTKAKESFNKKINDLLFELKPDTTKRPKTIKKESSAAHTYISGVIDGKDIEITSTSYVNQLTGNQVARFFPTKNGPIGLNKNSYPKFANFIEELYNRKEIKPLLSQSFLYNVVFKWFEKKYKGIIIDNIDFITYVEEKGEESINKTKISIPVSFLGIQKPFKIGEILFEYITEEFCDNYLKIKKSTEQKSQNFRNKYQGIVIATVVIEAEKQKCIEIAEIKIKKALTVLRFLSPSAFYPEIPSYFGIMGKTFLPINNYFVFDLNNNVSGITEGNAELREHRWFISAQIIDDFSKRIDFQLASTLIFKEDMTEFEEIIINSINLFERSLTAIEFQDKIVYVLVSIETLLLNNSEPIQNNIGLKLAFLAEFTPEKRKELINTLKGAYIFRSKYIHHGKISKDWELLKTIQVSIWCAIRNALVLKNKFSTRAEFYEYLNNKILS